MFDRYDVLVSLSQTTTAQPLLDKDPDEPDDSATSKKHRRFQMDRRAPDGVSSLCGLPAISIPCGFDKKRLPIGMQIMSRALNDATVLRAARLYQTHTDWHQQHPSVS